VPGPRVSDEQDAERAALRQELGEIASSLRAYVEWQRDAGTIGFPRLPKTAQPGAAMQSSEPEPITAAPVADVPVPPPPPAPPAAPAAAAPEPQPLPVIEPRARLPQLGAEVAACRKCGLCSKRKRAAFGRGDVGAQVMFVGEAPGQEDDEQGRPFVGRAGQLLDKRSTSATSSSAVLRETVAPIRRRLRPACRTCTSRSPWCVRRSW
jgi:hypothetical protein